MLDENLPVTLQYQLRAKLLERIEKGDWPPGYQIPSERECCEEYGVSRMTVREVLKALVQEGYLVRKQGKGTFVSVPKFEQTLVSNYSLSQEIEERGLKSSFRMVGFNSCEGNLFVRQKLGLAIGDGVYEIERLRLIGNEIFAYDRTYVPYYLMIGETEDEIEKQVVENGLYNTIQQYSGLVAEEAEENFEAVNCPGIISNLLQIEKNTAVIHLTRLTKAQDKYIEYCDSFIHGEKYKYKHVFKKKK